MGVILTLSDRKELFTRTYASNYKNENNFETLTVYLPITYNGKNLSDYTVLLNILNVDEKGDIITLLNPVLANDRYKYELPIKADWTYKPGKLTFWIKFISSDGDIGITNESCVTVSESREISDYIPPQSLSLLDEWEQQMIKTNQDTEYALETIKTIQENPPYIGENLTWYIYDTETHSYIDSGISVDYNLKTEIKDDYWLIFGKEINSKE